MSTICTDSMETVYNAEMMHRILFVLGIILVPLFADAQVAINEISWMGSPTDTTTAKQQWRYEWIELYNFSEQPVLLNGWTVELSREKLDSTIVLSGTVNAKDYFVAGASDTMPFVNYSYQDLRGLFLNGGQTVALKDAKGNGIEKIPANGEWLAGDKETMQTMERRFPERAGDDKNNWGTSFSVGGTPKAENSIFGKEIGIQNNAKEAVALNNKKEERFASSFLVEFRFVLTSAALLALGSVVLILVLRRYLLRSADEDSYDVQQD